MKLKISINRVLNKKSEVDIWFRDSNQLHASIYLEIKNISKFITLIDGALKNKISDDEDIIIKKITKREHEILKLNEVKNCSCVFNHEEVDYFIKTEFSRIYVCKKHLIALKKALEHIFYNATFVYEYNID